MKRLVIIIALFTCLYNYGASIRDDGKIILHDATLTTGNTEKMVAYQIKRVDYWVGQELFYRMEHNLFYDVTWSSSDNGVATVDAEGFVTAHAPGVTVITATSNADSGVTATAKVKVIEPGTVTTNTLREGITWVGCLSTSDGHRGEDIEYAIQIKGDTVVEGRTYKKAYRFEYARVPWAEIEDPNMSESNTTHANGVEQDYYKINRASGESGFSYNPDIVLSKTTPAACLREDNGRVYRLCDKQNNGLYYYNNDFLSDRPLDFLYPHRVNETETHYEVVLYDFNDADVYFPITHVFGDSDTVRIDSQEHSVIFFSPDMVGVGMLAQISGYGIFNTLHSGLDGDFIAPMNSTGFKTTHENSELTQSIRNQYVADNHGNVLIWDPQVKSEYFDYNNDTNFDSEDVKLAIQKILFPEKVDKRGYVMDKNFDKMVDIEDINLLINGLLNKNEPVNTWQWSDYRN